VALVKLVDGAGIVVGHSEMVIGAERELWHETLSTLIDAIPPVYLRLIRLIDIELRCGIHRRWLGL